MSRTRSETTMTCQNPECEYYLTFEGRDIKKLGEIQQVIKHFSVNIAENFFMRQKTPPFIVRIYLLMR